MGKRKSQPEEALGPVINGLELLFAETPAPTQMLPEEEKETDKELANPVALIIGGGDLAEATARLAASCGFEVRAALPAAPEPGSFPCAETIYEIPGLDDIVRICEINRDYFVCVFLESARDCELALSQCLASDAAYLGMAGSIEKKEEVFSMLREDGEPDAELAAIAAPMGLNIGAETLEQQAVAIVAEMLASRSGKLKRLHHGR